jgi:hypothetical protein
MSASNGHQIRFDKTTGRLTAFGRNLTATNTVRNEINGMRRPTEVVYTVNADGSKGKPYYPRGFPVGVWTIKAIIPHEAHEPYLHPFYIRTDAHQPAKVYALDFDDPRTPRYGTVQGQEEDYDYGLHYSSSSTTLGCIKITRKDELLWLVEQINKAWAAGETVTMEVV